MEKYEVLKSHQRQMKSNQKLVQKYNKSIEEVLPSPELKNPVKDSIENVRQTFELKLNSLKNEFNQNLEDIKQQENQRNSYND